MVCVADRDQLVKTWVTDKQKRQLREWSEETGKSQAQLVREAVHEYLDHDRVARVEGRLDDIEASMREIADTLGTDTTHTHKAGSTMNQGSKSVEKSREIIQRLQANYDGVIQAKNVERAIEDIAGADDRTLRKYKDLFRRRGLLFEHPGSSSVWTFETDEWVEWLKSYGGLNGPDAVQDVAEPYPVSTYVTESGVQIEIPEAHK